MADVFSRWVTRSVSLLRVSQGRFLHDVGQASLFGLQAASGSLGLEKRAGAQTAQNRYFEPNVPQIQKLERSDKNMSKSVAYAVIFRGAQQFQTQKPKRWKTVRIHNKYPRPEKCQNARNHQQMRKMQNLEIQDCASLKKVAYPYGLVDLQVRSKKFSCASRKKGN